MTNADYRATLPASWFYDPEQYRRELGAIWYRDWLCVGREEDWPETGDFHRIVIGAEQVLVVRSEDGELKGFHNTCRHRGSLLCEADAGRFEGGRIVCPYHAWVYGLDGALLRAPRTTPADALRLGDFPLYRVAVEAWRGFVFVNLEPELVRSLPEALGEEVGNIAAWPLEDLRAVYRETHRLACNWKLFWENYLECYHCPGVHPDLCKLVPLYRTGYFEYEDAGLEPERPGAMLRSGAKTWSADGDTPLPWFEGLGEAERDAGMTFVNLPPTMFLVAHVDYVRSVRVMPRGPEETELAVDWYLHRDVAGRPDLDLERLSAFASKVIREDGRACELNQAGLRCGRHNHGVLVGLENYVHEFENWVRERLDRGRG